MGQPLLVAHGHLALGLSRSLQELDVVHQRGFDLLDNYKDFFHGHFSVPKAVPLGGALDIDLIQTMDNPGGPDKP